MTHEIDLHGLEVLEAVESFVTYYNDQVKKGDFRPISVIHGYGSSGEGGKIRLRLRSFLEHHADHLLYDPGEKVPFHNMGETIVYPHKALPSTTDFLSDEIRSYCQNPKTKSKIIGKFRRHGETKIQTCLNHLEKQQLLFVSYKGKHKLYSI